MNLFSYARNFDSLEWITLSTTGGVDVCLRIRVHIVILLLLPKSYCNQLVHVFVLDFRSLYKTVEL